ncbi:MAG TPA: glycosyltransferase family 2 protein [Vicinamibacterales bacterium]|nr:glycosyltransferase family 2 protein [Vicinamibacterales bacterium]
MAEPGDISIVIPAFNEAEIVGQVVVAMAGTAPWREILVIDDGSTDDTGGIAEAAGARVVRHPYNKGNGASVKTAIRNATGEYVLIVDGDGQHRPADAARVAAELGRYDLVVGARTAGQASRTRGAGNRLLNWLAGYLSGRDIPDLTSGLRGARLTMLREFIHLLPNGFSTPTTTTMAFLKAGHNVTFVPVEAQRRVGRSKINLSRDGMGFLLILLRVITIFSPLRIFLPISLACLAVGVGYAIFTIITELHITNTSVLLIILSVIIFLVGLVSEQISALRFEGRS